jgi:PAS domain S-box-containing protein
MDRPEHTESDVSDPSRNGWHLAEGHALLAAIVESSDDAIIGKDLNGIILSWDKAAERIFGYTAREAIGQSITILSLPECTAEMFAILARIRQGERIEHFETIRRAKDGRLLDVSLTVSPVRNGKGGIIGASKVARDITDSKRAADRLRDSEARFRAATIAASSLIWTNNALGQMEGEQPAGPPSRARRMTTIGVTAGPMPFTPMTPRKPLIPGMRRWARNATSYLNTA